MSKRFIKGNTYVFSKKIYSKERNNKRTWDWAKRANGCKVEIENEQYGRILFKKNGMYFEVSPEWCKCIENNIVKGE